MTETKVMKARNSLVAWGYWAHNHRNYIHYAESRPIPVNLAPGSLPFTTDCSGIVTMFAKWSGISDPNGAGYSGWGYTGTLLAHLQHIPFHNTWRGDLVVFGGGTGTHVVMLLGGGFRQSDPPVASHGHPGADDPSVMPLSSMRARFPGQPVTYLRIIRDNVL